MNRIAILDLETDPFEHNTMIYPFLSGFYDGEKFVSIWGDDCIERTVKLLGEYDEPLTIFAHNGGKFDYFYFLPYLGAKMKIVNSRIIQAYIGKHEIRDSFAILPFALEKYKKTPIDYEKFVRSRREKFRQEIIDYLRDDCTDLYDLVSAFVAEFGPHLTIGSAAMAQLKRYHTFACGDRTYDSRLRSNFFFGGRNQVFHSGIIKRPIKIYDVNSMYPYVMRDFLHPVSTGIYRSNKIEDRTCFVTAEGKNYGAFPTRLKNGSLSFEQPEGVFSITIHEWRAAIDTGTFQPKRILETIGFERRQTFDDFVTHFYDARKTAKKNEDRIHELFYKYVLNSAYGKFALNPENYCDYYLALIGELPPEWHECDTKCESQMCRQKWEPDFISHNGYIIWKRPIQSLNYYNVATGASITGAARAVLLRGLHRAVNPLYCDTDSIICESLDAPLSDADLGAWKLEGEGDSIAICGKKLYAVFRDGECVKKAHKGARLSGNQILCIARGATVEYASPVPAFKFDGSFSFVKRNIRKTA